MELEKDALGDVIKRLRRAEGQIRGVIAMLEPSLDVARLEKLFLSLA
ncbi:metal-sensing transcriptional repressor [Actinoplanes awajinensis]|nr:metal-sensing transcriptional repressor [Actinoplanes awajinensis]